MAVHNFFFRQGSLGCRMMTGYYTMLLKHPRLARFSHVNEHVLKLLSYGCRDCGDCALPDMAYCCPQDMCAKQQRNGPCGDSKCGLCGAATEEKPCAWTVVYARMKGAGKLDEMRAHYVPPRRMNLASTSGWSNYFLGRDHAAGEKPPQAPGEGRH